MKSINVKWIGHSCFKIEAEGYSIVLDPYSDGYVKGLENVRESANEVICSHNHGDHGAVECVKIVRSALRSPFKVTKLNSYHDEQGGQLRGENTIHIFEDEGIRIAHLGDIGCMPEEGQISELKGLDAVMVPIGGTYTLEPDKIRELLNIIKPNVIIPMHYRSDSFGFDNIKTLKDFLEAGDNVKYYDSNNIDIKKDMENQIAILSI